MAAVDLEGLAKDLAASFAGMVPWASVAVSGRSVVGSAADALAPVPDGETG